MSNVYYLYLKYYYTRICFFLFLKCYYSIFIRRTYILCYVHINIIVLDLLYVETYTKHDYIHMHEINKDNIRYTFKLRLHLSYNSLFVHIILYLCTSIIIHTRN